MPDSLALDSTVAVVTGASSGIGEATALALAAEGATVALVARRAQRLERLAEQIALVGPTPLVIAADLTDAAQPPRVMSEVVAKVGRIDVLVNNAGVMLLGSIVGAPLQEWERMIDINVRALLHCAHAALPYLLEAAEQGPRNVADLVNVSSVAGRKINNGSGVYNLTKHGIGAFSESLRQEITRRYVRVGLVEPGAVATELVGHNRPEVLEALASRPGLGSPMQGRDIADAILYMVTRPRHVAINELLVRPTDQER
ncbi:MAG TPA: SDR family NAD(P)-dependent oxidoreductase [Solirubrobacteraceae bacterium]|jgi:NADP-dependent 3-hydroxy acid dehydrogenase YdfG|nr:SDR family NAD(P)-dependent oxidoreductase [Solirubrobacteraceae bacterium]